MAYREARFYLESVKVSRPQHPKHHLPPPPHEGAEGNPNDNQATTVLTIRFQPDYEENSWGWYVVARFHSPIFLWLVSLTYADMYSFDQESCREDLRKLVRVSRSIHDHGDTPYL